MKRKPFRGPGRPKAYAAQTGEICPGVTTVLKHCDGDSAALMGWACKMGRYGFTLHAAGKPAREVGHIAHELMLASATGTTFEPKGKDKAEHIALAMKHSDNFDLWLKTSGLEVLEAETPYVSDQYLFGGTIDLVLIIRDPDKVRAYLTACGAVFDPADIAMGATVLGDLKTGRTGPYFTWVAQLGAYGMLVAEKTDHPPPVAGVVIHTGRGAKPELPAPVWKAESFNPVSDLSHVLTSGKVVAGGPMPVPSPGALRAYWIGLPQLRHGAATFMTARKLHRQAQIGEQSLDQLRGVEPEAPQTELFNAFKASLESQ